jgi:hypothetical protein
MRNRLLDILGRAYLGLMVAGCPRALCLVGWALVRLGDARRLGAVNRMTAVMLGALQEDVEFIESLEKEGSDAPRVSFDGTSRWFSFDKPKDEGLVN